MRKEEQLRLTKRQRNNLEMKCLSCGWTGRVYQMRKEGDSRSCPNCDRVAFGRINSTDEVTEELLLK